MINRRICPHARELSHGQIIKRKTLQRFHAHVHIGINSVVHEESSNAHKSTTSASLVASRFAYPLELELRFIYYARQLPLLIIGVGKAGSC